MNLFQLLDPYLALQNYYLIRKNEQAGFSYSLWADELDLQSSSTLRMMVNRKKKLSMGVAEKFLNKAFLQEDEKSYFRLLVVYAHAPTASEKMAAWQALSQILIGQINPSEVKDSLLFISDLILPKIQTLTSFNDYNWTEAMVAAALGVEPSEVLQALEKLEKIGMVDRTLNSDGTIYWKSRECLVKVTGNPEDLAFKVYNNACLDEAKAAQELPQDLRGYRSLILPLNEEELKSFSQEIEMMAKQIVSKYYAQNYSGRRLFRINVNYFPVSEPLDALKEK